MSDSTGRYIVIEGSHSAHCCFTHSVMDTTQKDECVCETFSKEDADLICDALNELDNGGDFDPKPIVDVSENIDQTKAVISANNIIKNE